MKSFRDPVTGVLKAHGYTDINEPNDIVADEDDGFDLAPGKWKWDGSAWVPYSAFDRAAAMARLKATRTPILDALTGIAGRLDRRGMTAESLAADTAAQALLDLPSNPLLGMTTDDKTFDKTALLLYRQIAAACPPVVQAAFIGAM